MSPRTARPAPDYGEIGRRIRTIRRRRGLSLDTAAGLAGISKPYLSQIETGARRVSRRGLLEDIASALGCSVVDLTGEPYVPVDGPSATALATIPPIQLALLDCDLDDVPDQRPRPLADLELAVRDANRHRDHTRYELAGRELGQLLVELQITAATGDESERRRALTALVEAGIVAYEMTKNLGHPQLAVEAARRGLDAARRLGDPTLLGFARWYYALALMRLGSRRRAAGTLSSAVDDLASVADPTANQTLSAEVYGLLHITSALEAARSGRADDAWAHVAEARSIADRTGERNSLLMHFGPTNVTAWSLAVGVELGEGAAAIERAHRTPVDLTVFDSANRVAAWHFDHARAYAQEDGRCDLEAIRYLDTAERTAPQRLHHDPIARELLLELDGRLRTRVWELGSLRHRFGVSA
ncbi:MAG TPA: helix-turn-helix domain-containing protein [Actinophytocola sp.]|uniref:helix-turn-helix domain-containing protein n=1 Tax=Actinophytocola sp. TaxID=1872138 RepID=UPI002DDD8B8A|nr:helix-turn-helix domain-containing protein [Actinophytocola sp.]HEV2778526.1 helix-turn-helix domain-containing protein [Actinophytocola sp.]